MRRIQRWGMAFADGISKANRRVFDQVGTVKSSSTIPRCAHRGKIDYGQVNHSLSNACHVFDLGGNFMR